MKIPDRRTILHVSIILLGVLILLPWVIDLINWIIPSINLQTNVFGWIAIGGYTLYLLFINTDFEAKKKPDSLTERADGWKKVTEVRSAWGKEDLEHKHDEQISTKNPLDKDDG